MPSADELAILRALPLEVKIQKSKQRIREWLEREDSYVAFSGGKDSTVLAHLVHQVDPNDDGYRECGNKFCIEYLLNWLQQPAEIFSR